MTLMSLSFIYKPWKTRICVAFLSAFFVMCLSVVPVKAQTPTEPSSRTLRNVFAVDENTVMIVAEKNVPLDLWGIEKLESASAQIKARARTALDNIIDGQPITCEFSNRTNRALIATCVNYAEQDIGLYMLQQGYVVAAREDIFGTDYQRPYVEAERQAQNAQRGVWKQETGGSNNLLSEGAWYLGIGFTVFLVVLGAFVLIALIIMGGFKKVLEAQNDNVQMMSRERKLREKERSIVAVMLDAELKANKAKIEAYIVVYEEVMRGLNDPVKPPKYKKAGDIVQRHPSLDRTVFDRNTDKIDILGPRLSSQLIHFYARIKNNPEYMNIEPDMPLQEVKEMVSESLESAQRLNALAEELLESFSAGGLSYEFDKEDTVMNLD